jgi:hypothetical protein
MSWLAPGGQRGHFHGFRLVSVAFGQPQRKFRFLGTNASVWGLRGGPDYQTGRIFSEISLKKPRR